MNTESTHAPAIDGRGAFRAISARLETIRRAAEQLSRPYCGGAFPENEIPLRWHRIGDVRRMAAELAEHAHELEVVAWADWYNADQIKVPAIPAEALADRRSAAAAAVAIQFPGAMK